MAGGSKRHRHHHGGGSSGTNSGRGGVVGNGGSSAGKTSNNDSNNNHDDDSSYDFCQRFFGDPLFTNRNVLLLFLTATFLPLIVWIPHFVSEHGRNRQLRLMEEERLSRMQLVKIEMEKRRMRREAMERDISKQHSILDGVIKEEEAGGRREHPYDSTPLPHQYQPQVVYQQEHYHQPLDSTYDIKILQDSTSTIRSSKSTDVRNFMFFEEDNDGAEREEEQQLHENTFHSGESYYEEEYYANSHSRRKKKKNKVHSSSSSTTASPNSKGDGVGGSEGASVRTNQNNDDWNSSFLVGSAQLAIPPTLCSDGITIGYDDWYVLRDAISMSNAIAAMNFLRWNEYLATSYHSNSGTTIKQDRKDVEPPQYIPPEPFVICPGVTLTRKSKYGWRRFISPYYWMSHLASVATASTTSATAAIKKTQQPIVHPPIHHHSTNKSNKNKLSSIFINAEDITIECDMCVIDLPGTHFSFGPHAKNVHIKGVTFRGATTSSLTFHHHGSEVRFEDCYWLYNSGIQIRSVGGDGVGSPAVTMNNPTMTGAVADLNSTSTVAFYRCVLDETKQSPKRATTGAGVANVPGMNPPAGHFMGGGGGGMMMMN